jgi:hypothetical protein
MQGIEAQTADIKRIRVISTKLEGKMLESYERLKKDIGVRTDVEALRVIIKAHYKSQYGGD